MAQPDNGFFRGKVEAEKGAYLLVIAIPDEAAQACIDDD